MFTAAPTSAIMYHKQGRGHAEADLHIHDSSVPMDNLLDFPGRNVFAPPDDHVLQPAHNSAVPLFIQDNYITSVQPACIVNHLQCAIVDALGHPAVQYPVVWHAPVSATIAKGIAVQPLDRGLKCSTKHLHMAQGSCLPCRALQGLQ